ncbi:hypothetical protein NDA13_004835 [Ustilago tritici]|nr:hypothetical protein NDA13_004835 [Ustilago tritici]
MQPQTDGLRGDAVMAINGLDSMTPVRPHAGSSMYSGSIGGCNYSKIPGLINSASSPPSSPFTLMPPPSIQAMATVQGSASAPSTTCAAAPSSYTAPAQTSYEDSTEDSEPVLQWHKSQKDAIAKRDAKGEHKKAEAISKAKQDIDNFYAKYNTKKEKNIAVNKESKAKFQEQHMQELAKGTTWDRVTKILELKNS